MYNEKLLSLNSNLVGAYNAGPKIEGIVDSDTHGLGVRVCVNPDSDITHEMRRYRIKYATIKDPYRLCSCGSGKKWKFCCKGK